MAEEAELRALLLKGLAGDEAAHRKFLMEAAALLRPYFRNRLRGAPEDAEDLVQETLVALHTRRDSYEPTLPLTAWMYAIARYRLIDFLRRKKRRGEHTAIDALEIGAADPAFEAGEAKRDVTRLLARLPEKQRRAIELVKLQEHSVEEASKLTGYGVSDIKVSIHRGMKALMKLMAQESAA
jgi:RNA polymerase sigma-70 factor (ECF subfamily)